MTIRDKTGEGMTKHESIAFVLVRTSDQDQDFNDFFTERPEIIEAHYVAGEECYLLKVGAENIGQLGAFVQNEISRIPGVISTKTLVALRSIKVADAPSLHSEQLNSRRVSSSEAVIRRFWQKLLEKATDRILLHSRMRIYNKPFIVISAGLPGLRFCYDIALDWTRVSIYVDRLSVTENKEIFDQLHHQREAIETDFGDSLLWERLDSKRACRISFKLNQGGYRSSEDRWATMQESMIEKMEALVNAFSTRLRLLKI